MLLKFIDILTYSVITPGKTCADNGMVDLDSDVECTNALPSLQVELPGTNFITNVHNTYRPAKCYYSKITKGVFWNSNSQETVTDNYGSICKGNRNNVLFLQLSDSYI